MTVDAKQSAAEIAAAVRAGSLSAVAVAQQALARIGAQNPRLNAFTDVTRTRALAQAAAADQAVAAGRDPGPMAGVPFAVKNLFDVADLTTRAGSRINRDTAPAASDATLTARLEAAGAVLCGSLNMGEYAYDFTGENAHDGASVNPHDLGRMSGGSSGGSGTAVAAGMVPLALGSDTNGSIRVPASFCGIFGLKPTYGRLSRHGTFPFVASLDHLGPFARSVIDLALAYDVMQGPDADDPAQTPRAFEPTLPGLDGGIADLRIARLGGYFRHGAGHEALAALDHVARALGATQEIDLPHVAEVRSAAFLITMAESAALHLGRLRSRAAEFDPDVRDRLLAGAMLPAPWIVTAQKQRRAFATRMAEVFGKTDILLAPATPCTAPALGEKWLNLAGERVPLRPNIGIFTQPISAIGLPVVAVPVWIEGAALPVGVQVIAPPWREDLCLRVARYLELAGAVAAPVARGET
ncbi:MAG: AtzE family amidohydrolase [Rhodobacteraceae bacterium]|nr:AtzE family amidohydrolase [Paracoccaceae bacterium]MCF8516547.1 AtzE family amidohydrolase [Paracoccaceae bacterium]MCF8520896.1 AtzE family amidohydrolase [Paracoccaceae bacterium]